MSNSPGATSYPALKNQPRVTRRSAAPTICVLHPLYIRAGTGYNTTLTGIKTRINSVFLLDDRFLGFRILPPAAVYY